MKKLNVTQMENLQGGLIDLSRAAGVVCGIAVATWPLGTIMFGGACVGLLAGAIWG